MCGVDFTAYWVSNLLFDAIAYLITLLITVAVFFIFNRSEYISASKIGATFALYLSFGAASISLSYAASHLFTSTARAEAASLLGNFLCGFLFVVVGRIFDRTDTTSGIMDGARYFLRILPAFSFGDAMVNLAALPVEEQWGFGRDPWRWDLTLLPVVYMLAEVPLLLAVAFLLDHPWIEHYQQRLFYHAEEVPPSIEDEDSDVEAERGAIEGQSATRSDDTVRICHLNKVYPSRRGADVVAVRNLSFGVRKGEVFGFLGTNGAGKTTTLSILTGDFLPTHGHVEVAGRDVVNEREAALRHVGYCPQFDAVLDLLTPVEHLRLFAALRSITPTSVDDVVGRLLQLCDLTAFSDVPASQLSGGNRRKLSLAISLVGGPDVLLLDEPSAGMDPLARRKLWKVIRHVAAEASVILATHHLEEAEVLADRVAIMVSGKLECIGTLQHLKDKHGSGYEVSVKVASLGDLPGLYAFMAQSFPASAATEEHFQHVTFALPADGVQLAAIFSMLGSNKERLHILDFSVSRASLEQLFLRVSGVSDSDDAKATT